MIPFERYFFENGFKRYLLTTDNKKLEGYENAEYSLAVQADGLTKSTFMLSNGVEDFIFGFNEYHKPITLISPRPKIVHGGYIVSHLDDYMNRVLKEFSFEFILKSIKENITIEV